MGSHAVAAWSLCALILGQLATGATAAGWPAFTSAWQAASVIVDATADRLEATWHETVVTNVQRAVCLAGVPGVTNEIVTNRIYRHAVRPTTPAPGGYRQPFEVQHSLKVLYSTNLVQVGVQTNIWTNGALVVTNTWPLYRLDDWTITTSGCTVVTSQLATVRLTNHPARQVSRTVAAAADAALDALLAAGVYIDPSRGAAGDYEAYFATITGTNWTWSGAAWAISGYQTPTSFPALTRHRAWELAGVGRIVTNRIVTPHAPPLAQEEWQFGWQYGDTNAYGRTITNTIHATTAAVVQCDWTLSSTGAYRNAELAAVTTARGHPNPHGDTAGLLLFGHYLGRGFGAADGAWSVDDVEFQLRSEAGGLWVRNGAIYDAATGTNVLWIRLAGTQEWTGCYISATGTNRAEIVVMPRWLYRDGINIPPHVAPAALTPALRVLATATNQMDCTPEPVALPRPLLVTVTGYVYEANAEYVWISRLTSETVSVTTTGQWPLVQPYREILSLTAVDPDSADPHCYPSDGIHVAVIWTNEAIAFASATPWLASRTYFTERRDVIDLMRYTAPVIAWTNVTRSELVARQRTWGCYTFSDPAPGFWVGVPYNPDFHTLTTPEPIFEDPPAGTNHPAGAGSYWSRANLSYQEFDPGPLGGMASCDAVNQSGQLRLAALSDRLSATGTVYEMHIGDTNVVVARPCLEIIATQAKATGQTATASLAVDIPEPASWPGAGVTAYGYETAGFPFICWRGATLNPGRRGELTRAVGEIRGEHRGLMQWNFRHRSE